MALNYTLGDKTEAYYACATVFKGRTHVFGGKKQYNQVKSLWFLLYSLSREIIPFAVYFFYFQLPYFR